MPGRETPTLRLRCLIAHLQVPTNVKSIYDFAFIALLIGCSHYKLGQIKAIRDQSETFISTETRLPGAGRVSRKRGDIIIFNIILHP